MATCPIPGQTATNQGLLSLSSSGILMPYLSTRRRDRAVVITRNITANTTPHGIGAPVASDAESSGATPGTGPAAARTASGGPSSAPSGGAPPAVRPLPPVHHPRILGSHQDLRHHDLVGRESDRGLHGLLGRMRFPRDGASLAGVGSGRLSPTTPARASRMIPGDPADLRDSGGIRYFGGCTSVVGPTE